MGKQQVVSEAVAQADTNNHQEKEYKDSKNNKMRQRPKSFCRSRHQEHDKAMAMDPGADDKSFVTCNQGFAVSKAAAYTMSS